MEIIRMIVWTLLFLVGLVYIVKLLDLFRAELARERDEYQRLKKEKES